MQYSLVLLKPDAFERKLVGDILNTLEDMFTLERMEMRRMDPDLCELHYEAHIEKPFYPELRDFMCSGPVLAVAVSGESVDLVRRVCMTIRNMKRDRRENVPASQNVIHASDSELAARRELEIWFPANPLSKLAWGLHNALQAADELLKREEEANERDD